MITGPISGQVFPDSETWIFRFIQTISRCFDDILTTKDCLRNNLGET